MMNAPPIASEETAGLAAGEDADCNRKSRQVTILPTETQSTARTKERYHFDWVWECLAWLLGAATLGALVGIIATARDQSAGSWRHQHANISINAIVAVLSAIVKGTCTLIVAEGMFELSINHSTH